MPIFPALQNVMKVTAAAGQSSKINPSYNSTWQNGMRRESNNHSDSKSQYSESTVTNVITLFTTLADLRILR